MSHSSSSLFSDDEELSDNESTPLHISQEVMRKINAVIGSTDPFDDLHFNSIDYINMLFPTEQSLSNVDGAMSQLKSKIHKIDDEMRILLREQISSEKRGKSVLLHAQQVISQLINQVLDIKNTAEQSEETVKEIIHEIKQLDSAKQNLTIAITTLNHLQILTRGINTIRVVTDNHMYKEIVEPLQGVVEVMKHLQFYTGISKVNKLITKVHEVQEALTHKVIQDFREAVTGENAKHLNPTRSLAEICLVIDILDSKVKRDLLIWFVERQLDEYFLLFNENEEISWLDKIDRRYTWFKKHLIQFENKFASMFPPDWEVSERITVKFCQVTKAELAKIMAKRAKEIDVKLLLYAFQKTSSFEQLLAVRFTGNTLLERNTEFASSSKTTSEANISKHKTNLFDCEHEFEGIKEVKSTNEKEPSIFHNIIGECFIPYLYIFIDNLDNCLFEMMEKFIAESKRDFSSMGNQGVLSSCADLFVLYKRFLVQCGQLSNGPPMLSLNTTFGKYLREYACKILRTNLPKLGGSSIGNPLSTGMTSITREISSASLLLQNFLKEDEEARFSKAEIKKICCILTTAEYCLETTKQLEDKLKKKVDPFLADKVNLSKEQDIFASIISNCIQLLVSDLESLCQTALGAMTKIQWQTLESAGDQSGYVTTIISHLQTSVSFIKESLASSRKYFTHFCINFVKSFIPKFVQNLYKCKPLRIVGAEQLLLDTQTLKTALLGLPTVGSVEAQKAPDCYTQIVIRSMSRGEKILKLVMAPNKPEAAFVDQFLNLLPNSNIQEFQKILDMKGLRATDKSNLLTVFCIRHSEANIGNKTGSGRVRPNSLLVDIIDGP